MTVAPETEGPGPVRPQLAFRVGVTGARNLAALPRATQDEIHRQAGEVLEAVRAQTRRLAAGRVARALYAAGADGAVSPRLRLLSPLAEGADRLLAELGAGLGYDLDVALPFPREDYARDFAPESRAAFDRWLDGASDGASGGASDGAPLPYLALDGGRGADESRSYEAVGRLVVRNCDLLIAVWDGQAARGRGGTGDIVRFAARFGPPVWWIDAAGAAAPRLVRSPVDLRAPDEAPQGADAFAVLEGLVAERLLPASKPGHRHRHGLIGHAVGLAHRLLRRDEDPYRAYLGETPRPQRWPWSLYRRFLRLLGGAPRAASAAGPVPIVDRSAAYWESLRRPADRGSSDYADRYRSSYIAVFGLATLAVLCAITSLVSPAVKPVATTVEGLTLVAILWLVALNQRRNWHGRWIAYRLLAELCRKRGALAVLGWSLPPSNASRLAAPEAWVGWYFNAARRAAPLPAGGFTPERLAAAKTYVARVLLAGQAQYHRDRKERSARAAKRLAVAGEMLFLATLILVLGKLGLLAYEAFSPGAPGGHDAHDAHGGPVHATIVGLGIAAAILPALSAALLGVRAYAELELLESQSTRMEALMHESGADLDRIRLDRPLASQDLAAEVFDVAGEMLQDVNGWADLFRVKAVEAG